MSAPDVRVRLTPEGVAEVVAALKKVQAESAAANKSSAGGVGLVSQALRELKKLLPTIGLAATAASFVALTRRALETADATGKLQQKVGGTVEDISALTLAFRQNNSNQEELAGLLRQTTLRMDELRTGSSQVPEELSRIGVSIEDIRGLDAPRVFELIAQRLANIPDEAERAALATGIFKKSATDLIPALNAVGTQGIDQFMRKARELGVLIDGDLAEAAQRANDALGDLKLQVEGLATQFSAGFAPQVAAAMKEFSEAIEGDGFNSLREFATFVGFVIRQIVQAFTSLGRSIGAIFASIATLTEGQFDVIKAAATGRFKEIPEIVRRTFREIKAISDAADDDLAASRDRLTDPGGLKKDAPRKPAASTIPGVTPEDKRIADARTAFLRAQLENELSIIKASLSAREDANSASYQQGLISLEEYYKRRREIAKQASDAELAALKAQRAVLVSTEFAELQHLTQLREETRRQALGKAAQQPAGVAAAGAAPVSTPVRTNLDADIQARRLKARQELAKIDAEIAVKEIEAGNEQQKITAEETEARRQSAQEQLKFNAQLSELEGNRHLAFEENLKVETDDLELMLKRAGASAVEITSTVNRLRNARTQQFDFEEISRRGSAALDSFNRDAEQIQRDQQAGIITQLEGENRIIELERQRLEVLKQLAAEALKAAEATKTPENPLGNEDQIRKAQQYADSVAEIEASFKAATDAVAKFRNGFSEGLQTGLEDLFNSIGKIRSLSDAWHTLGDAISSTLRRVAAELLSKAITRGIENIFDSLASGISKANSASAGGSGSGGGGKGFLGTIGSLLGALFGGGGAAREGGLQEVRRFSAGGHATASRHNSTDVDESKSMVKRVQTWLRFAAGGHADATPGGLVRGPGSGTSDSIPAIVAGRRPVLISNREYIVRNRVVEQPGALSFLHAFNARGMAALRAPRFAEGGLMSAAIAAAPASSWAGGGSRQRPLQINQTIQAQTPEQGRRTAKQSGLELQRALRRAEASNG